MIFILAGTYSQAKKWAAAQQLSDDEWFCTLDLDELKGRENFHVVVLETASELTSIQFEKLFHLAHIRGRINRT
jgi:hypothetical protein